MILKGTFVVLNFGINRVRYRAVASLRTRRSPLSVLLAVRECERVLLMKMNNSRIVSRVTATRP